MKVIDLIPNFNPIHLQDLDAGDNHSVFAFEDNYQVLIIRGLYVPDDEVRYRSYGFIEYENDYYFYNKETKELELVENGFKGFLTFLLPVYQRNQAIIDQYIKEVDQLEDSLYERNISRVFMDIWFDLKKDLSRIERFLKRNHFVLKDFYKMNFEKEGFENLDFRDLLEDVEIAGADCATQASRLDALEHYYTSIKNDKLNSNLYLLTILSAVFLPLNLIVGFFGMNTENLFFKDNPNGTMMVVFIISGSLLLTVLGLPLFRFLDKHLLRFILGRYDIYKKFSSKLDNMFKVE